MKEILCSIRNVILELLFPNVCGICGKICKEDLCKKCAIKLNKIVILKKRGYLRKNYGKLFYIFAYHDLIKEKIIDYKFKEEAYIYKSFVKFMIKNKKISDFLKSYDIIIPVPIHSKRKRQRGYNQSALIALELSKNYENLTCLEDVLIKVIHTKPQSTKTKEDRKKNVQGVYELRNQEKIKDKKILLFDDIYTTGSTVDECAKTLKKASIKKVDVLTIAKD